MKPSIRPLLILCLIALSSLHTGCEKRPFDYRNQYTGNYDLTYQAHWWIMNGESGSTTEHFSAVVYYDKKHKGMIKVRYANTEIEVELRKNGDVYKCGNVVGKFEENSFAFDYNNCGIGGLGGSGTQNYSGVKK